MPSRVLITGASGFIGSRLARELIALGHEVHVLVRSTPARLTDLAGQYHSHPGDLCDETSVGRAVEAARPDVVYHAAAFGTFHTQRDRAKILSTNLLGTAHLLEALRGRDLQALVNLGSSLEYGHKSGPMRPEDRPEPRSDYGVAKAAATMLWQAEALRGRPAVTVRVFSAYGPDEDPTRLASHLMTCCRNGQPCRVTDGTPPRDWIYVDDVVRLLRLAAETPACHGHILHAGSGKRQTVRDMVETVIRVANGIPAEYGAAPRRADEPSVWVADLTQTTALTGWTPQYELEEGVRRMWEWFMTRSQRVAA